jgi:hypothetical protein
VTLLPELAGTAEPDESLRLMQGQMNQQTKEGQWWRLDLTTAKALGREET